MSAHTEVNAMNRPGGVLVMALLALAAGGCGKDGADGPSGPAGRVGVTVSPLTYPNLADVRYRLTVWNGASPPEKVWERDDLTSSEFGNGRGALSYVGPCDASENDNTVELAILDMYSAPNVVIPKSDYVNPAPDTAPIRLVVTCLENADVPVDINLTVMRRALQGFFDIGVQFEDVFCSAKFDCLRDGEPIDLLFNPATDERDVTVVLGFACTSGGNGTAEGEPTWLHLSNVLLQCEEEEGGAPVQFLVSPNGVGQVGPAGNLFYQVAIYHGQEALPDYDKCFWNMAFGVKFGVGLKNCRLRAQGTASDTSWAPTGASPAETIYPVVQWDIDLTGETGQLACQAHALDDTSGAVTTDYTDWSGTAFANEWECGQETPITSNALACVGGSGSGQASFAPQPGGFSLAFGNQVTDPNQYFALPEGWSLGAESACCLNPCCDTP